jgi:DNA-binding NtrC family response regulator
MLTEYFREHYDAAGFSDPREAVQYIRENSVDVVLTDLNMPELDGMEILQMVKSESPATDVIIMTAYAEVENAVEAMKHGAFDYIIKPLILDDLSIRLSNLFDRRKLSAENANLRKFIDITYRPEIIIGTSKAASEIRRFIEKVSETDFPVMISGESGVGKEVIARAIHFSGKRRDRYLMVVNCSEFSPELLEHELFGYDEDSIRPRRAKTRGLFEQVEGGTIVLDDIEKLPLVLQARLVSLIEKHSFKNIGGTEIPFNGMLIALAGNDLRELTGELKFRDDLYYRLNMLSLKVPSLRNRRDDIPDLAGHFFSLYKKEFGRDAMELSGEAVEILKQYHWPGNVRELKGLFAKICLLVESDTVRPGHILAKLDFPTLIEQSSSTLTDDFSLTESEKNLIIAALEKAEGNATRAAKYLNVSYDTLRYRIKKYGIEK